MIRSFKCRDTGMVFNYERNKMKDPALNPVHPGEILLEDCLKPLRISQFPGEEIEKTIHPLPKAA